MSELTVVSERRALRRSGLRSTGAPAPVTARSVLLLQGFGMPGGTLKPLAAWFTRGGWEVAFASVGWNVGCGEATVGAALDRLQELSARSGQPSVVVGHSRGGVIGRVAAVRQQSLVAGLVTVCTPWAIGPPDRPGVATVSRGIRFARRRGLRTMGSIDCDWADCCRAFRGDMTGVPAPPWAALWSSVDTIGGAESVPPAGPDLTADLRTSHLGAVQSVAGWTAISDALSRFGLAARLS